MSSEVLKVKSVRESGKSWDISCDGSGFGLEKKYGIEPKVGDEIELRCYGSRIDGMKINGLTVFDKTEADIEMERQRHSAKFTLDQIDAFEKNKAALDAKYDALPDHFKRRLDKFRKNNISFRWEYEPYEMSVCVDAVKIAEALKTPEEIKRFRELDYREQKKLVPGLDDGHSGNSFGMAVRLAYEYLNNPENVVKLHGALAPMVGSEAYGCVPKKESAPD